MTRLLAFGSTVLALAHLACSDPTLPPAQAGAPPSAAVVGSEPASGAPESPSADPAPAITREETADVRVVPPAESGAVARDAAAVAPAPAPSAATLVREATALDPGGPVPLTPESETVVDPAATFRVELAAEIPDGRLVLLDAADAIVPASGTREVGATTRFTLSPATPLVPGSRYVLRLDGARTRELEDAAGRAFAPVSLSVLVAGEPPKPEPRPPPRKKRGR
jgi:hypothetical protein